LLLDSVKAEVYSKLLNAGDTTMNRRSILAIALLNVLAAISALAQTPVAVNPGSRPAGLQKVPDPNHNSTQPQSKETDAKKSGDRQSLTSSEARLVSGSKTAILETGISEPYFEVHFRLVTAINTTGDRRVVWKFSINEYEATLNDAVGYYTSEDGRRVDVHSIKDALGSTHDIERTIPKKEAERIMNRCIGKHTGVTVVFQALTKRNAALVMTASPVVTTKGDKEKREREEKSKEEKSKKESEKRTSKKKTPESDTIREEGDEGGGPSYFGILDLESGRCTKGKAIVAP